MPASGAGGRRFESDQPHDASSSLIGFTNLFIFLVCQASNTIFEFSETNRVIKTYCKGCYESLYGEVSCKFCGVKLQNNYYHKHPMYVHQH